ncbi:MAG: DEAD/DEAH box helicase [Microthrixaceae bacterium]
MNTDLDDLTQPDPHDPATEDTTTNDLDAAHEQEAAGRADVDPRSSGFAALSLSPGLVATLTSLGYEEPTPVQRAAIGSLMQGRDLVGQAATGTGKTAAFALPIIDALPAERESGPGPYALILAPTRELALQVSEATHRYGRHCDAAVVPLLGGQPIGHQIRALRRGADVVVATPGRCVDHLDKGTLRLDDVVTVVLDEADEMLDMGFAEDLDTILAAVPAARQTVLFSATMPKRLEELAARSMRDPISLHVDDERTGPDSTPLVRQRAYVIARHHKPAALGRLLDVESPESTIVFCRTRVVVDELTETLNGRGYRAEALHGGMSQEGRDRVMGRIRSGTAELLIATDVAARGLDIEHLTHVVNFDVPAAAETYVHRIGRVGRAGREGTALTLVEPRQNRLLHNIERTIGEKVPIQALPTVADLHSARTEATVHRLRERITAGELDGQRAVLEELTLEFDPDQIALGALALLHEPSTAADDPAEQEIPDASLGGRARTGRPGERRDGRRDDRGDRGRRPRPGAGRGEPRSGGEVRVRPSRDRGDDRGGRTGSGGSTERVYIPIGKRQGVRPGDLVGAICGETGLSGRDIGAIQLRDSFSLVEVPARSVSEVIDALDRTTIRGQEVHARRDRFDGDRPDRADRPRSPYGTRSDRPRPPYGGGSDRAARSERPDRPSRADRQGRQGPGWSRDRDRGRGGY